MEVPVAGTVGAFLTRTGQALYGLPDNLGLLRGGWPMGIALVSAGIAIGIVAMLPWRLGSIRLRRRNQAVAPPAAEPVAVVPLVAVPARPLTGKHIVLRWLRHDSPYIAMLLLALAAVIFRLPVVCWVILVPVFGVISGAEGWRHFDGRGERVTLLCELALSWLALLLAILLLFDTGVQGVMNANATSLAMMILLGLGTFVSGVQARVWQICAVGGVLFVAVPGIGWLDQSPLLIAAAAFGVIALGGVGWWLSQPSRPADGARAHI
jgi:hypothetical protein